ncbi:hypothetical protein H9623_18760 [Oerskovia sp. Sa1BUA8]|uniref:Transcriptional regulator, AbiEi antitoxin, Type IV TA system n=1 Tax=Oerskovia douganii TaxID=2762210 RepID=A0A9D5Z0S9_9CELL|nr:hypothetical protein [Oerskovia douganii]MBE7702337.1 hypothetical protein [Oerskovia douganii]
MTTSLPDHLVSLASRPGGVVLAAQLPRPLLRTALSQGLLEKVRRGAYRLRSSDEPAVGHALDRLRAVAHVEAVSRQLRSPFVLSQDSAALVWDLPLWRSPDRVHVVQRHRPGAPGEGADLVRHQSLLGPTDTAVRLGYPVTSFARTVVDCARTLPALDGLVVVDAALRRGLRVEHLHASSTGSGTGEGPRGHERSWRSAPQGRSHPASRRSGSTCCVVACPCRPRRSRSPPGSGRSGPTWAGRGGGPWSSSTGS